MSYSFRQGRLRPQGQRGRGLEPAWPSCPGPSNFHSLKTGPICPVAIRPGFQWDDKATSRRHTPRPGPTPRQGKHLVAFVQSPALSWSKAETCPHAVSPGCPQPGPLRFSPRGMDQGGHRGLDSPCRKCAVHYAEPH